MLVVVQAVPVVALLVIVIVSGILASNQAVPVVALSVEQVRVSANPITAWPPVQAERYELCPVQAASESTPQVEPLQVNPPKSTEAILAMPTVVVETTPVPLRVINPFFNPDKVIPTKVGESPVPNPRLVRAVEVAAKSERLLARQANEDEAEIGK
jgi:hypothetical protein